MNIPGVGRISTGIPLTLFQREVQHEGDSVGDSTTYSDHKGEKDHSEIVQANVYDPNAYNNEDKEGEEEGGEEEEGYDEGDGYGEDDDQVSGMNDYGNGDE